MVGAAVHPVVAEVRAALEPLACASNAEAMARYMRDRFTFLGLKTPDRRRATLPLLRPLRAEHDAVVAVVDELWAAEPRELQYVACDLLDLAVGVLEPDDLPWLAGLITTRSWWDTVDPLAKVVGEVARGRPAAWGVIDGWADHGPDDERMWLARASILQQLRYGEQTDAAVLFDRCLRRAGDDELFIRKAIGWALRQHARVDPDAVRAFVAAHRDVLSPLSIREATKHL